MLENDFKTIKDVYSTPELYEYFYQDKYDINFYFNLIKEYDANSFLELGCGSGRVSIPILEKTNGNVKFSGVDLSSKMLDFFRKKINNRFEKDTFELFEDDFRTFDFKKNFPVIIMPNNSFAHMTDEKSIEDCLLNIKKHLNYDGVFAFSVFLLNSKALSKEKDNIYYICSINLENEIIDVYESLEHNLFTQISKISWYFISDKKDTIKKSFDIKFFFHQELKYILKYYGFKIINIYGDYDKSLLNENSIDQIFVVKNKKGIL